MTSDKTERDSATRLQLNSKLNRTTAQFAVYQRRITVLAAVIGLSAAAGILMAGARVNRLHEEARTAESRARAAEDLAAKAESRRNLALEQTKEAEAKERRAQESAAALQAQIDVLNADLKKKQDERESVVDSVKRDLAGKSATARADMLWRYGKDRLTAQLLDDADYFFTVAESEDPKFAPALLGHGEVATKHGNLAVAIQWYRKAVAVDPAYKQGYLMIAWAECNRGNYSEAEIAANKALQIDPSYTEANQVFAAIRQRAPNRQQLHK